MNLFLWTCWVNTGEVDVTRKVYYVTRKVYYMYLLTRMATGVTITEGPIPRADESGR